MLPVGAFLYSCKVLQQKNHDLTHSKRDKMEDKISFAAHQYLATCGEWQGPPKQDAPKQSVLYLSNLESTLAS
jgi:hypothetical protein